ncbi:hypothetical protein CPB83DRAFT_151744 [Crepidotus variabilis]|uniref:Uncharacterized protein n=1 Tax=Crepidotus variabilis TaxID=179855 RepID=A0A9P6JID3_9AGAR|nr:hypothetical protein CPB83DRAFT_151744 [Crepidotus variabilis]
MHEPSFTALDLEDSQIAAPLSRIDSTPIISTSLHSSKVSPSVPFVSPSEIIMAIVGAGSHSSSISTNVLPFPLRHGDYEMQDLTGDIHVAASDEEPPAVEQEHKPSPCPVDEETTAPKSPNPKELKVTEARPGKRDIAEGMVEDNPEDEEDEDEDDEDESGLHGDQTESKGKERATDQAEELGDKEEIDHDGKSDNIPSTFLSSTNKTRKPAATAQVSQPSVNDIDNLHSETSISSQHSMGVEESFVRHLLKPGVLH